MNEEHELIPIEQQTLLFYGKPIIVVRLPDGRPGVVVRFFCENMQIDTAAQLQRIRRTEAIAEDLITMQITTEGGTQKMAVLVLHSVPFWLAGIDPKRVREEIPNQDLPESEWDKVEHWFKVQLEQKRKDEGKAPH